MLTDAQRDRLWNRKLEAEARSLYFADIANFESTIKRWITGGSFVLGSTVLVTLLSHLKSGWSIIPTLLLTTANGYQIAVNQEGKIKTAGKLHMAWEQLECEYDQLWSHTDDPDAEAKLRSLEERERDLSETAATDIGHSNRRWHKWWDRTVARYAP